MVEMADLLRRRMDSYRGLAVAYGRKAGVARAMGDRASADHHDILSREKAAVAAALDDLLAEWMATNARQLRKTLAREESRLPAPP